MTSNAHEKQFGPMVTEIWTKVSGFINENLPFIGKKNSSQQETQKQFHNNNSDHHQNSRNDTASQNPESEKTLKFDKPQSSVDEVVPRRNQEAIRQVIYKESLSEAVMNLALEEEQRNVHIGNGGSSSFGGGEWETGVRMGEVGFGRGVNGEVWKGSDGETGNYSKRHFQYPLRIEDCPFYMKTGNCKFGMNCKFNHPPKRQNQGTRDRLKPRTEDSERPIPSESKGTRVRLKPRSEDSERSIPSECKVTRVRLKPRSEDSERSIPSECKGTRDRLKPRSEDSERSIESECKYYLTSGGCRYGSACKYNHSRERSALPPIVELNFLGLPIRLGEKECPYYMLNGSCKYGLNCKFNHPDPTPAAENDPVSGYGNVGSINLHGAAQSADLSWSSPSMVLPQSPSVPSNPDLNGYQTMSYPTSERSLPTPPTFAMNSPAIETNFDANRQQQMPIDEFPQRPGQRDCGYFLRTGDCKHKANCKYHHPKLQTSKPAQCAK